MKTIVLIVLALILISCSTDDYNEYISDEKETYIRQDEIPDKIIGTFYHSYGQKNEGSITISKTTVDLNTSHKKLRIEITPTVRVIDNPICYTTIILPDGTIINLIFYKENGLLVIEINGEVIGIFEREPHRPQEGNPQITVQ